MSLRGAHVRLLAQASAKKPSDHLDQQTTLPPRLKLLPPPTAQYPALTPDPCAYVVWATQAAQLGADASSSASDAALASHLRNQLFEPLAAARGSPRNQLLFLVAVLSGEPGLATPLQRAGAVPALFAALALTDDATLSALESQWALLALANVSCATVGDTAALVTPAAASVLSTCLQEPPAATASNGSMAAGTCYAALAVVSNLAMTRQGAEALAAANVYRAVCPLLGHGARWRGTLSVPSARWLFTGHRTQLGGASLGGGAARAVLNGCLSSAVVAGHFESLGIGDRLRSLSQKGDSENVRCIAGRAADHMREVIMYPKREACDKPGNEPPSSDASEATRDADDGSSSAEPTDRLKRRRQQPKAPRRKSAEVLSVCEFERIVARRVRDGNAEYLVQWRDPTGGERTWEPMHHIHDPATVAAFERGRARAAVYSDWAWAEDPCGAGWTCVPMDTPSASSTTRAAVRQLPAHWPPSVQYTPTLLWGGVPSDAWVRAVQWRRWPNVVIRPLNPQHPAARHAADTSAETAFGLFASCAIPCSAWLGDYSGLVKPQSERDSSKYLIEAVFTADKEAMLRLDIDAERYGNEARMLNDFNGIAPQPNVSFVMHYTGTGEPAVGCITRRQIRAGEELTVDYGEKFWEAEASSEPDEESGPERQSLLVAASPDT